MWCVCTSVVSLSQPALGQAFPAALAGRALSAFNLVIFAGVFSLQWSIGLALDVLRERGLAPEAAFRVAFSVFLLSCVLAFAWRHVLHWRLQGGSAVARRRADNPRPIRPDAP
jgi:hypothetical protein